MERESLKAGNPSCILRRRWSRRCSRLRADRVSQKRRRSALRPPNLSFFQPTTSPALPPFLMEPQLTFELAPSPHLALSYPSPRSRPHPHTPFELNGLLLSGIRSPHGGPTPRNPQFPPNENPTAAAGSLGRRPSRTVCSAPPTNSELERMLPFPVKVDLVCRLRPPPVSSSVPSTADEQGPA